MTQEGVESVSNRTITRSDRKDLAALIVTDEQTDGWTDGQTDTR